MNVLFFALQSVSGISVLGLLAAGVVIVFFVMMIVFASRYTKVGPNEVLVISGRRGERVMESPGKERRLGFRIVKGGGAIVWPVLEKAEILSLEIMTLEVPTPEVYTITGVPVIVDGVAQIKVRSDDSSIRTAAELFLGKSREEIAAIAHQTIEGHLRAIIGTLTMEEIYKEREKFSQKVQEIAATDLANMGLSVVSFVVKNIADKQGYLDALGKPRTAQVKRDAIIAQAEADRDATIRSAAANQAGMEAKFAAETRIAEANRDFEMKRAEYQSGINLKKAEADLAYDLQKFKTQQLVKAEEIKIHVIEKERQIEVQEKEIRRRERELEATVNKPADAERYRMETLANARQFQLKTEAEGQAQATRSIGTGEADATKAKGLAQAEIIKAQGFSEADAMSQKAEAWKAYGEAALAQMMVEKLPEIARAISEPLSKTEKIVIVNMGQDSGGASKLTGDVTKIMAQLPHTIEALTGMNLTQLIDKVRGTTPTDKTVDGEKKEKGNKA